MKNELIDLIKSKDNIESNGDQVKNVEIITDGIYNDLKTDFLNCDDLAIFVSPFIKISLSLIKDIIVLNKKIKKIIILTTTFGPEKDMNIDYDLLCDIKNLNKSIEILIEFVEVKDRNTRLHSKAYYFRNQNGIDSLYIGSGNFTRTGLKTGKEIFTKFNSDCYSKEIKQFEEYVISLISNNNFYSIENDEIQIKISNQIQINRQVRKKTSELFNEYLKTLPSPEKKKYKVINELEREKEIITLFDYQEEAIENFNDQFYGGIKKHLLVMATGTGKTITALSYVNEIAKRINVSVPKVLFVAHKQEILEQTKQKFIKYCGYKEEEIMCIYSGKWAKEDRFQKNLIIASVQTLKNHFNMLERMEFDLTIFDEVHHVDEDAKTFDDVFKFADKRSNEILGMTATPIRTNGNDVIKYFNLDEYTYQLNLFDALNSGYLSPMRYYMIYSEELLDFDIEKNKEELSKKLSSDNYKEIIKKIANDFIYKDNDKKFTIVFCSSIENANEINKFINDLGYKSDVLSSENSYDREFIINRFKNNKIEFLCVVDILNEGIDIPEINNVVFLRPTMSKIIYLQQLGRGLRKLEGKKLNVFDVVSNINVSKNKKYNPLEYISDFMNPRKEKAINDLIYSPKLIKNYLPADTEFIISQENEQGISKLLQKIYGLKDLKKISELSYEKYEEILLSSNFSAEVFYEKELRIKYFENNFKNGYMNSALKRISLINIRGVLLEIISIIENKRKSNNKFVNIIFLRSIINSQNKIKWSMEKIDDYFDWYFNSYHELNDFNKELLFLIKFKLNNEILLNNDINNDIESFLGIKLFAETAVAFCEKQTANILGGVHIIPDKKRLLIIATRRNEGEGFLNAFDYNKNVLNWPCGSNKTEELMSCYFDESYKKLVFYYPGDKKNSSKKYKQFIGVSKKFKLINNDPDDYQFEINFDKLIDMNN